MQTLFSAVSGKARLICLLLCLGILLGLPFWPGLRNRHTRAIPSDSAPVQAATQEETKGRTVPVVRTGIETLEEQDFAPLHGKRVGLITNPTGVDSSLRTTID